MIWRVALLLPIGTAVAGDIPRGRSYCESNPTECRWPGTKAPTADATPTPAAPAPSSPKQKAIAKRPTPVVGGNLPGYLTQDQRPLADSPQDSIIVSEKPSGALLSGLRAGDVLVAELEQSIKASPSVPTPIRARITRGKFRGSYLLGTATLDRELKRILLAFEHMRLPRNEMTYVLKATGLSPTGQAGLEGDYHTQEGLYFAGEIVAATAAGYADATTQRSQAANGTYQTEPTAANATKQGAVTALAKTAERFAERARSAPEYTEIEAGREIQIIIQENPTEAQGQ